MVCAVNRATRDLRVERAIERLDLDARFRVSATGFHFLTLLEGKADCAMLLRAGTKKWDSCAGEALLRARGGCVTDAAGRLYDYGDGALALNRAGLISSRTRGPTSRSSTPRWTRGDGGFGRSIERRERREYVLSPERA